MGDKKFFKPENLKFFKGVFLKKPFSKTAIFLLFTVLLMGTYFFFAYSPFQIQAKPETILPKKYDYYVIVDKKTNLLLMYVPVTVRVGDELISENNKRYVVIEVVDDVAYAQFVEDIYYFRDIL